MRDWLVVLAVAAGTYLFRASLVLAFGRWSMPPFVRRAVRFVGPAVLAAIAVSELAAPEGHVDLPNLQLAAGAVAAGIAWRWENLPATVAVGLATFYALEASL